MGVGYDDGVKHSKNLESKLCLEAGSMLNWHAAAAPYARQTLNRRQLTKVPQELLPWAQWLAMLTC